MAICFLRTIMYSMAIKRIIGTFILQIKTIQVYKTFRFILTQLQIPNRFPSKIHEKILIICVSYNGIIYIL